MTQHQDPSIDRGAIDRLESLGGAKLVGKMIQLFREAALLQGNAIEAGLDAGDLEGVRRAAHSLKSSAGNLGATRVMELANEIEGRARVGDGRRLIELRSELRDSLDTAVTELDGICRALVAPDLE